MSKRLGGICALVLVVGSSAALAIGLASQSPGAGTTPLSAQDGPGTTLPPLPERERVQLPDGSLGWLDSSAVSPPNRDGMSDADGQAALDNWHHTLVPVTAGEDRATTLVGYIAPTVGFIDLATAQSPDFNLDAMIATAKAKQDQEQQTIGQHP